MKIARDMTELVGRTPLVRLNRVSEGCAAEVVAKLEFNNPCASVKDRIALAMIDGAMERGELAPGGLLVEPTSGNTGVGLAFVAAVRGLTLVLTMPESMSNERKALLRGFGARLVLTPASRGMRGAIEEAERIVAETPGAVMLGQFVNPDNPMVHRKTTAEEIWADTDGKVDAFVAGVGTGGTVTGTGRRLRELNPSIRVFAVEPDESPVLSGGTPARTPFRALARASCPRCWTPRSTTRSSACPARTRWPRPDGCCARKASCAAFRPGPTPLPPWPWRAARKWRASAWCSWCATPANGIFRPRCSPKCRTSPA